MSTAHDFHVQAEEEREQGNLLESLELTDKAMIGYGEEENIHGFTEVQVSRANTFKHLFQQTNNTNYLVVALYNLQAALEIAKSAGKKEDLAMIYQGMGKILEQLERYSEAAEAFQWAVNYLISNPPGEHNRPGVLADFKGHLAIAQYRAGDKSALARAEDALKELMVSGEDKVSDYNYNVWLSGAHMRIAEVVRDIDPSLAKEHLQVAKKIIDLDPRLTLRKGQWEKMTGVK